MLWQSSLSADGNSPSVGRVTLPVSRIVVWIIIIVLQLQVIHFLEQRLIYLHVVSSIFQEPKNWISDVSRLWSVSNSCLPLNLFFPACSSSFIHFFLISKSSTPNLAFQFKKFSTVTGVPRNNCFSASSASFSFCFFSSLLVFIWSTI